MPDLHARLLAEIEGREVGARRMGKVGSRDPALDLAYLASLREIVGLHRYEAFHDVPDKGFCALDQRTAGMWPCETIKSVARALGVEP